MLRLRVTVASHAPFSDRRRRHRGITAASYDPHIVQLRKGGSFDPNFGGGDGISSNWADGYRLVDVEIRRDGEIAGTLLAGNIASFRLGHRGAPLDSYGGAGVVFTSTPLNAEAMFLDRQDRPVITGSSGGDAQVVRLES